MKAVLWADTAQLLVMISGLLAVAIRGCMEVGGLTEVWRIAEEGGRINFNRLSSTAITKVCGLQLQFHRQFIIKLIYRIPSAFNNNTVSLCTKWS